MKKLGRMLLLFLVLFFLLAPSCVPSNGGFLDPPPDPPPEPPSLSDRIQPGDFEYLGAFLTPPWQDGTPDAISWEWGGTAMAYRAQGDPHGPSDGFPGSLFGAGHDVWQLISEIDIPVPVVSPTKNLEDLNVAQTLQGFADLKGSLFDGLEEMLRVGIEILPPMGAQSREKLYLCWGDHIQEDPGLDKVASHMWCETDLANPDPQGAWWIGDFNLYSINDYLFEIPQEWADAYTPGMRLATGRYRDGGWSGFGPTLVAIGPWNQGNPPGNNEVLPGIPLIRYSNFYEGEPDPWYEMDNYAHSDEWSGGAWLTVGDKAAVLFVGTKGVGDTWYGNQDGPCLDCDNRGWWSDAFEGQFLLFDPQELAKVATGEWEPWQPQPYAVLRVDEVLYYVDSLQDWYHLGACSFDRERGILYVFEPGRGENERTLVHAWKVH